MGPTQLGVVKCIKCEKEVSGSQKYCDQCVNLFELHEEQDVNWHDNNKFENWDIERHQEFAKDMDKSQIRLYGSEEDEEESGDDMVELQAPEPYHSKTKGNVCKNDNCVNERRNNSAYCQECSNNWKVLNS